MEPSNLPDKELKKIIMMTKMPKELSENNNSIKKGHENYRKRTNQK